MTKTNYRAAKSIVTKIRNKSTRDQIAERLSHCGWEFHSIDEDTDWWAYQHWTIVSTQQMPGLRLVLSFMVDPQYEGLDKATAVYCVTASSKVPAHRLDEVGRIAEFYLQKGKIPDHIPSFVEALNTYRDYLHKGHGNPID